MTKAAGAPVLTAEHFQGKPRILDLGSQAFTLGGATLRFPLEKTGNLDALVFRISGQYDVSTAALVGLPRFPWNLFSAMRLSPSGRQKLMDIGSWSAHLHDLCGRTFSPFGSTARDVRIDGLDAQTGRSALIEAFPLATGNDQAFELWLTVPFRRSATDPRGRVPLFNASETVLYLTPNSEANLITTPANWAQDSMNVQVWQIVSDDAPRAQEVVTLPDGTSWVVTYEEFETVAAVGNNDVTIDPGGRILRVIHTVALNDVLTTSDDISGVGFKVDATDIIEPGTDPRILYYLQKRQLGHYPPDGVLVYDFDSYADSDGAAWKRFGSDESFAPSIGRQLHTDRGVVQIESRITIPSGTTLGTNPRIYTTVARMERAG